MSRILDIEGREYNGVWRLWKLASIILFAAFVAVAGDIAVSLRAYCRHTTDRGGLA